MNTAFVASELEVKWENFHFSPSSLIIFRRKGILNRKNNLRKKSVFKGSQYGLRPSGAVGSW